MQFTSRSLGCSSCVIFWVDLFLSSSDGCTDGSLSNLVLSGDMACFALISMSEVTRYTVLSGAVALFTTDEWRGRPGLSLSDILAVGADNPRQCSKPPRNDYREHTKE